MIYKTQAEAAKALLESTIDMLKESLRGIAPYIEGGSKHDKCDPKVLTTITGESRILCQMIEALAVLDTEGYPDYAEYQEQLRNIPKCDQCQMLNINGVNTHETDCPNQKSRWDATEQTWISQRVCFECGYLVDADDPCCNGEEDMEDMEDIAIIDHGPCGDWTA